MLAQVGVPEGCRRGRGIGAGPARVRVRSAGRPRVGKPSTVGFWSRSRASWLSAQLCPTALQLEELAVDLLPPLRKSSTPGFVRKARCYWQIPMVVPSPLVTANPHGCTVTFSNPITLSPVRRATLGIRVTGFPAYPTRLV